MSENRRWKDLLVFASSVLCKSYSDTQPRSDTQSLSVQNAKETVTSTAAVVNIYKWYLSQTKDIHFIFSLESRSPAATYVRACYLNEERWIIQILFTVMRLEKPAVASSRKKNDCLIFKWCMKCRLCKAVSLVRTWRKLLPVENNFGVLCHRTNQNVGAIYLFMSRDYTSEKGEIDMFSEGLFPPSASKCVISFFFF